MKEVPVKFEEESYRHYINMIQAVDEVSKNFPAKLPAYPVTLDSLSRIVDIAFNEGRMEEITQIKDWEMNDDLVIKHSDLQDRIETAFTLDYGLPDEAYKEVELEVEVEVEVEVEGVSDIDTEEEAITDIDSEPVFEDEEGNPTNL